MRKLKQLMSLFVANNERTNREYIGFWLKVPNSAVIFKKLILNGLTLSRGHKRLVIIESSIFAKVCL